MPDGALYVLAGPNGGGKSSVLGAALEQAGRPFYNPDQAARELMSAHQELSLVDANSAAWAFMERQLAAAIVDRASFAFETTLGGNTIARHLAEALDAGIDVHVWYVALDRVEHHVARIEQRVKAGGHPIPEAAVRRRYVASLANLARLAPRLTSLAVFDNSVDADPPQPTLLVRSRRGRIVSAVEPTLIPAWAEAIIGALLADPQA